MHQLVAVVTECGKERLPSNARFACQAIVTQLHAVQIEISGLDKRITQIQRTNADCKRLTTIPGFGVILSTAVAATMADPKVFRTGRDFAAWIGLVPRQIRQAERNASARFPSKAIVTCDDCSSSAQHPSSIVLEHDPTSIPG